MIDKSLSFGMQNYFFVKSDETDGSYNYYGFVNKKGAILLMQTNKTTSLVKYCIITGDFDTVWTAKATKTYVYPSALVDPSV